MTTTSNEERCLAVSIKSPATNCIRPASDSSSASSRATSRYDGDGDARSNIEHRRAIYAGLVQSLDETFAACIEAFVPVTMTIVVRDLPVEVCGRRFAGTSAAVHVPSTAPTSATASGHTRSHQPRRTSWLYPAYSCLGSSQTVRGRRPARTRSPSGCRQALHTAERRQFNPSRDRCPASPIPRARRPG